MKLKYVLLCVFVGMGRIESAATTGYKKADEALQAMSSAVPRFAPDNFFTNGISPDGKGVWNGLLNGIQGYLNNNQADLLSKGLLLKDKDLYMNNMKTMQSISTQLINNVTNIHDVQFKKGITLDAWEKAKTIIDKLTARTQELGKIAHKVNAEDAPAVKDIKNVLNTLSLYLKATVEKVGKDLIKVKPTLARKGAFTGKSLAMGVQKKV